MTTKSRNLTAEDKNTILHCTLEAMYKKLFGSVHITCHNWKATEVSKLGDEVYRSFVPVALEKKLDALPEGCVPKTNRLNCIRKEIENTNGEGYENRAYFEFQLSKQRPIPYDLYSERAVIDEKAAVWPKLRAIDKKSRENEKIINQLDRETRQLLIGIRTVRTLLERWPEVTQIEGIPGEVLDDTPRTALIVLPTTVNTMLGLK